MYNIIIMKLPPENECGCAEYKYKFDENVLTKTPKRKEQLQTQMLYRMNEGCGHCIYYIGVCDDGEIKGISLEEITYSESVLLDLINKNGFILVSKQDMDSHNYARIYNICRLHQNGNDLL